MHIARKLHAAHKSETFGSLGTVKALILAGLSTSVALGSQYPVTTYMILAAIYLLTQVCRDLDEHRAALWATIAFAAVFAWNFAYVVAALVRMAR